jgi:hypothetical protein
MDTDYFDTGMGLTPSGTRVELASSAHAAIRWTPMRCSAWRSSSVFFIISTAWEPGAACAVWATCAAWNRRTSSSSVRSFSSSFFSFSSALELVLGQQLFPPFPHLLPPGEVLLLSDEIRRPLL